MKISNILNLNSEELSKLSNPQLADVLRSLVSASNKRIKRIEQSGLGYASASVSARRTKSGAVRKFSAKLPKSLSVPKLDPKLKGVNRARQMARIARLQHSRQMELLSRIAQAKNFLTSPSSTIEGAKKSASAIARDLGVDSYDQLSRAQQNKFWRAYNMLKNRYPDLLRSDATKYEARRAELYNFMIRKTKTGKYRLANVEKSVEGFFNELDREYQLQQRKMNNAEINPLSLSSESGEDNSPSDDGGDYIPWNR